MSAGAWCRKAETVREDLRDLREYESESMRRDSDEDTSRVLEILEGPLLVSAREWVWPLSEWCRANCNPS